MLAIRAQSFFPGSAFHAVSSIQGEGWNAEGDILEPFQRPLVRCRPLTFIVIVNRASGWPRNRRNLDADIS
jgi:hypothetical protein